MLATVAIDAPGFGIVVPVVPTLVMQLFGQSASGASLWQGALLAAFSLMQFLCAPLLGAFSTFAAAGATVRLPGAPFLLAAMAYGVAYLVVRRVPPATA